MYFLERITCVMFISLIYLASSRSRSRVECHWKCYSQWRRIFRGQNAISRDITDVRDVLARTEAGYVRGLRRRADDGSEYVSFRGVPYAQQPLGELRFKELQPLKLFDDIYDATMDGPVCPQRDRSYGKMMQPRGMSEACIHANIHVPKKALPSIDQKTGYRPSRPILVFIHGGGFESGSGDADVYGPEYLVSEGIVIITFNYRLNVFGFLSLNTSSIPGNQGLRDCVTLLQWVQRNARAFGGDPDNVTLGGHSVAIPNVMTASPKYAQEQADQFLSRLGIESTDAEEVHRQLVQLPVDTIMDAFYNIAESQLLIFIMVVESYFPGVTRILEDYPETLIRRGRGCHLPTLIGFTNREAYTFQPSINSTHFVDQVKANTKLLVPLPLVYPRPGDTNTTNNLTLIVERTLEQYFFEGITYTKFLTYFSDNGFVYPAIKVAQWGAMLCKAPVFLYRFSYTSEHSVVQEALDLHFEGAGHIEDLTYMFKVNSMLGNHSSFPPKSSDDYMQERMTTTIANFIMCSNPGDISRHEVWPSVDSTNIKYQDIRTPTLYPSVELSQREKETVRFYDSILHADDF